MRSAPHGQNVVCGWHTMPPMNYPTQSIVDNVDVGGPGAITSINPATEEEIATVAALDAEGAQRALMDAYTQKKLRGKKLAAARRLIEQREARGKKMHPKPYGRDGRTRRPLTSEALVRAYQKEADRQKLLIKKAELTQGRLLFICQAFRTLLEDDHFVTLLRAEGLETMPGYLQDSLTDGDAP